MESYLISVTLADCCRHIQISADATLYRLHQAILNSVDFEDDHSHEFHMDNKQRKSHDVYVSHRDEPADRSTRQYSLRDLKLRNRKNPLTETHFKKSLQRAVSSLLKTFLLFKLD